MSEKKDFQEALDKAGELETMKFTETGINIDEYYSALEQIAIRNNSLKNDEAENVINQTSEKVINIDFITELNGKRKKVEEFIRTYDPNKPIVKDLELKDVDKIYAISNYLLNSYIQYVNEMKFNFTLSIAEYKFINKALVHEIAYNADEVFNYAEFMGNLWYDVQALAKEHKADDEITFVADIKMILILHHLIKGYTVKGSTNDYTLFKNVLFKIAQFNKLFNAYSIVIERIKSDREVWGAALDVVANEKEQERETVIQTVIITDEKELK